MNVLLLGGTADARKVVEACEQRGLLSAENQRLIYSVAGLVRVPKLACEVVSGGFTQFGGLANYCQAQDIGAILDITHPFAQTMSSTAVAVAKQLDIAYGRFHRPAWVAQQGDRWRQCAQWSDMFRDLDAFQSILLTVGQLDAVALQQLIRAVESSETHRRSGPASTRIVLRTAAPPRVALPARIEWLKAIGPFQFAAEQGLMKRLKTDLLLSKNSGGEATEAKLKAARHLDIEVRMLQRPALPESNLNLATIASCVTQIAHWRGENSHVL